MEGEPPGAAGYATPGVAASEAKEDRMVASEDEAKSVKDEPSTEGEKEKEPAERKTSRLRTARTVPDSSFGRRRGDEARDQLIAELEDAVDMAEANAFEAKVAATRGLRREPRCARRSHRWTRGCRRSRRRSDRARCRWRRSKLN